MLIRLDTQRLDTRLNIVIEKYVFFFKKLHCLKRVYKTMHAGSNAYALIFTHTSRIQTPNKIFEIYLDFFLNAQFGKSSK